ncbi:MAG: hypothetical protein JNM21_13330 [Taibaiella sp.]|nr:hypothetical protein [Taibaiella sp.]
MELRIKPAKGNKYERRALLVKGTAPELWFRELEALKISIKDIEAYAVPSDQVNVLYGCLLVFNKALPKDTRNHKRFQCAYNKFFIPENAALYPQLTATDIAAVKARWIIAHPDFGFVDLEAPIDWLELIEDIPETELQLRQPLEGIEVPDKIRSFSVEMDEEEVANSLLPQKTEEAWMKELPFNLQKVLNGNKKEAEKYLQYLAKYPDRALALGIPLDVMNTSRDKGWASFNFRSGWLESLFGGSGSGRSHGNGTSGSTAWQYLKLIAIGLAVVLFIARLFDTNNPIRADRSVGPLPGAATEQVKTLNKQYKELLAVPQKDTVQKPGSKDTLEQEATALRSKYMAAVYKYGSREVQHNKALKDSMRLQMDELELQMKSVSDKVAARDEKMRKEKMKKVQTELATVEKRMSRHIKDSIAKLPEHQNQSPGDQKVLYQRALERKKTWVRDSLELAYGLRAVPQDTLITRAPEFPEYETPSKPPGTFARLLLLLSGLLLGVIIFTKVIKGKPISMGGRQLSAGTKIIVVLTLLSMLAYILYPLIDRYGYNWLVGLILLAAAALMYRLLASDKTILKSDKDG